jgi:methionyl aminopeptidase
MIEIKSGREIEFMKEAGRIVALTHEAVSKNIKPGVSTKYLDKIAEDTIISLGGKPAFKGYHGFPGTICASINEQVVHGIPSDGVILKDGDIISVDIGASINGYFGDSAMTHPVGKVDESALKLIEVTKQSFYEGLKYCTVGYRISDISHAIQEYVEENGFSIVRDFVGHGIGRNLHEDPQIPNYGPKGKGAKLQPGMVLAIEPMVNEGEYHVEVLKDNWTVVTLDKSLSAHYEHTVLITDDRPVLLTSLDEVNDGKHV